MLKIAVSNKAFDLEISVEELEEMEANEPAKPLLVAPMPASPSSPRTDLSQLTENMRTAVIFKVLLASLLFLTMLYTLSVATYKSPAGVSSTGVKEALRELSPLSEAAPAMKKVELDDAEVDGLAGAITKELRKEIRSEVQKQLRGYHHEMLD